MQPGQDTETDNRLLFATESGWVRHCACHDMMVLQFLGHWLSLSRPAFARFHARLIGAVRCPVGMRQLEAGGRFAFRTEAGLPAFSLGRPEMEELLWLLDSARFMLDARDAASAGLHAPPEDGMH